MTPDEKLAANLALIEWITRQVEPRINAYIAHTLQESERRYDRGLRLRAYRLRRRWRKADAIKLLMLPGGVTPAAKRRIERILKNKSPGRGVVPCTEPTFVSAFIARTHFMRRLTDPATPPNERHDLYRQTKWYKYFVEAAYRGEREAAKAAPRRSGAGTPTELAEEAVAKVIGRTPARVHQICVEVRAERGGKPPAEDEPPMTAADLKCLLEIVSTV